MIERKFKSKQWGEVTIHTSNYAEGDGLAIQLTTNTEGFEERLARRKSPASKVLSREGLGRER